MRHTLHIATVLLAAAVSGCGNLENEPFLEGSISGRLTESDAAVAQVLVKDAPHIRSGVTEDGHFALEHVPAGHTVLFVLATETKAMHLQVAVQGGQSVSLGDVVPHEGGFLDVRLTPPGRLRLTEARVSVEGTPYEDLLVDERARLRVGPLASGCHTLRATAAGFEDAFATACINRGEQKDVRIHLTIPNNDFIQHGCSKKGCAAGDQCAPDGTCVQCFEDAHCATGQRCQDSVCRSQGGP